MKIKALKKYIKPFLIICAIGIILVVIANIYVDSKTDNLIFENQKNLPKSNVAIIFGAGIKDNKPGRYLKDRLDAGISLYKNNKVQKILLSGDNGNDAHDELTVMKLYCYEKGVDTTKIYIDYAGFDSYSTMYRAKEIFKVDEAILVTQKYHLNRCIYIGEKLGIKSYGYSANNGEYKGYKYYSFREYFSIAKSVLDVARNRQPHFLGETVDINGISNYTKEEIINDKEKYNKRREYKKDISDPTNKLVGKVQTLELTYIAFGCACANWIKTDDYSTKDNVILFDKTIFIEPANNSLEVPEKFDSYLHKIIVKGQFYDKPDFPKGTQETEEVLKKAPVFRYTDIKIVNL